MSYIPASDSLNILNSSGGTINPATEEALILLRKMVKLMEPLATQDSSQRQRVLVENSTVTVAQATAANLNANINNIANVDGRYHFMESARISYSTGIRNNLKFT